MKKSELLTENYTIIMKQEEISQKPSDCNRKEDTPSNLYSKSVFKKDIF